MMNIPKICAIFVAFTTAQAFHKLIPPEKETIYSWRADIKAGTYLPVPYASQFSLEGKIHLQPHNNSIFLKLTDLTHRVYNGIIDHLHEYEAKNSSLPQEVQELENVFRIVYTDDGLVDGISTERNEKEFSRNIKKAIASMFQISSIAVSREYHRPESFVVKENSIYGHGNNVYSVFPKSEEKLEVQKLHNMDDNEHIYSYFVTNVEQASCDVRSGKRVMHDSKKNYALEKERDSCTVRNISAVGSIVYYPFKAKSDSQVILVNQKFDYVEVVPIGDKYKIKEEDYERSLSYRSFAKREDDILDETNGRRSIDNEKLVPLVQSLLEDIPQYLCEDHINTEQPDSKRGQLINRVQQILLKFNVQKLNELRSMLSEEALNIYYHLLPLVGTEASTLYIKDLIVSQTVDEDIAINLLQNIAGHIRPSIHVVQKLEELIHLPSTFNWNLRKVAILSFGRVIYKSYLHQLHTNEDNPQTPFVQYVDEYINNLRNSSSYIVQVTYLLGLRNMKLPILAHRLVPALNGEWWSNQHLRYMAIWAIGEPLLSSSTPEKIIETFWTLFIDRSEKMEIRVFAYYYIMYSRPSLSLLRSIFAYMLTEPDDEVYRIHYTLSQTLMQSTDPCHTEVKLRLAEVLKFSPAPRRGTSFINFFGYHDPDFGYSSGAQKYFWKTNELRIYCYYVTSQLFGNYEEDWVVYWKIHDGSDQDQGLVHSITNILSMSKTEGFNFHIEASIARRGQVLNIYAFDKSNVQELTNFLRLFLTDSSSWSKNLWYINYERYESYMIPTDLGIPAFWQYLMPEVRYTNLAIVKDIDKDDLRLQAEGKYGAWIHYRHGLSFYNPIADVWQGINKYHAYDAVLPFHFNLSLDFKLQKLELRWQKHDDPQMNIAGFKTHARQVVFVDEEESSELVPQGRKFQTVDQGNKFRRDYQLLNSSNLETGYRWYLVNYDSDIHEPYGVFKSRLFTFADRSTKYFHSPLQHWSLAWLNFHRDMVLLPRAGTYGFLARLEPSREFNITSIEVTLHQRFDVQTQGSFVPGLNLHSHLVYSVKNYDKIMKTWDLNVLVQLVPGHSYGTLKLKLTRTLPERKDYKICVDGSKKWSPKNINGHLSVTMGQSEKGECANDTAIEITSIGTRSQEQQSGNYRHYSCESVGTYFREYHRSVECLLSYSTVRHYIYEVISTTVPHRLKQTLASLGDEVKSYFHQYYTYDEHEKNITKDSVKVDVTFPLKAHEINVDVITPEQKYAFSGVPLQYWDWFRIAPESTIYTRSFIQHYESGELDECTVRSDHSYLNKRRISQVVPNNWTLYVGNSLGTNTYIYLKQMDGKLAVKVLGDEHVFEILPKAENGDYDIRLDDVAITLELYEDEWFYYRVFTEDIHKLVDIFVPKIGCRIEYNMYQVVVTIPKGLYWQGGCYESVQMMFAHLND